MPLGRGKYDDVCSYVSWKTEAAAALVIVIGGNKGAGFSLQTADPAILEALPDLLEHVAKQLRADHAADPLAARA